MICHNNTTTALNSGKTSVVGMRPHMDFGKEIANRNRKLELENSNDGSKNWNKNPTKHTKNTASIRRAMRIMNKFICCSYYVTGTCNDNKQRPLFAFFLALFAFWWWRAHTGARALLWKWRFFDIVQNTNFPFFFWPDKSFKSQKYEYNNITP
jgi:hypothetical protein